MPKNRKKEERKEKRRNLYEKTNCKHRAFARNVPDIAADSGVCGGCI